MTTLEQRIAAIEDREAIADLILRHAEHIRSGTEAGAGDLFLPDAIYELGRIDPERPGEVVITDRIEGVAAIVGSKDEVAGEDERLCPMIHNIRIVLDGDRATSICVSMTTLWPTGMNFIGEYRDRFARVDGVWRFATRAFIGFGAIDGMSAEAAGEQYQGARAEREGLASG